MRLLSHCKEACGILAGKPMARRGKKWDKITESFIGLQIMKIIALLLVCNVKPISLLKFYLLPL